MKVMSVCLYDYLSSPRKLIDLSKEKASLDRYKNGTIPFGTIYLSGEITVTGKITFDPGPAGDIWFYPEWEFSQLGTAFSKEVSNFKFLDENQAAAFKVDESLLKVDLKVDEEGYVKVVEVCVVAPAKIRISGLRVSIGGTDEAGAYPVNTKVLHVGEYRSCK